MLSLLDKSHYFNFLLSLLMYTISKENSSCESPTTKTTSCTSPDGFCPTNDKNTQQQDNNCILTPQSHEGPFFLPNQPVRVDIREGRPGIPFDVQFTVKDIKTCKPVKDAKVHLWHADAMGMYSAYLGFYPLGDPASKQITGGHAEPTEKATFLRGIQFTDEKGVANFRTIYPGWYKFRALHTHIKVTVGDVSKYTGEIYYPDELTDEVAKIEPYDKHTERRLRNRDDYQFVKDNRQDLVMMPQGNPKDGFKGSMTIVVDLERVEEF